MFIKALILCVLTIEDFFHYLFVKKITLIIKATHLSLPFFHNLYIAFIAKRKAAA